MTLPVFRIAPDDMKVDPGAVITVNGSEGRHAVTVKRLRVGEKLMLGDGQGTLAICRVTDIDGKNTLRATVDGVKTVPRQKPPVTIVQGIPKGDAADLAVDLCTEAGADCIIPWQASRCVAQWSGAKKEKGRNKWRKTAIEAAKQSRRAWDPEIKPIATLDDIVALVSETQRASGVVAILHESARMTLETLPFNRAKSIVLIVGPEGGITKDELTALETAGGQAVIMGPTVLRSAAAGAVALGAMGVLTERW